MLWRIYQALIAFAVATANIVYGWTDNNYIVAGWCLMAAYAVTVFPYTVTDWWRSRHVRRAEYAMKKAAGIPYGWRRHLPRPKKPRGSSQQAAHRNIASQ